MKYWKKTLLTRLLDRITVMRPDLSEEDKCIILKQNTNTLPAEKAPAQTDQTEDWLQNLETPAAVIVTTEEI